MCRSHSIIVDHIWFVLQGYSTLTCSMGDDGRPGWNRALPSCQGISKIYRSDQQLSLLLCQCVQISCDHFFLFFWFLAPCGSRSTGSEGTVLSPNFPRNYTTGQTCVYSISVPREFGKSIGAYQPVFIPSWTRPIRGSALRLKHNKKVNKSRWEKKVNYWLARFCSCSCFTLWFRKQLEGKPFSEQTAVWSYPKSQRPVLVGFHKKLKPFFASRRQVRYDRMWGDWSRAKPLEGKCM